MAHLSQMPARTSGWAVLQRKANNLPATVTTLPWGVPHCPRIQYQPPVPETSEQRDHHNSRGYDDIGSFSYRSRQHFGPQYIPKWANTIVHQGYAVKTPNNTNPIINLQRRMFSCTVKRPIDGSYVKLPDAYDLSPQVPDYGASINKTNEISMRAATYVVVGVTGIITFAGVRQAVNIAIGSMSPAKDVLAMSKIEVDLSKIPEGKNVILKWRGKPVFVRHRTQGEIKKANDINVNDLRDPQKDSDRVKKPEWLVMLGICTHLGCVPIGEAGDFGGWFCPCHGSHYDISGRVRKGPAPLNLEIPEYEFIEEAKITIG